MEEKLNFKSSFESDESERVMMMVDLGMNNSSRMMVVVLKILVMLIVIEILML